MLKFLVFLMLMDNQKDTYFKGRGAQLNVHNKFKNDIYLKEHIEGIDDWEEPDSKTSFVYDMGKTIVNKVTSPDIGMAYSMNPYQGCEHGCIYCYARNSHQYWGYSAGLDFERKIIVKKEAPRLFKLFLEKKGWDASTISLSGNTDCYQPAERRFKLTRQLLEIALQYKQPIGIITKNALVLRDIDILEEMARLNLCMVYVSINSLNEKLRQVMEPRTTTARQRIKIIEELSKKDIPTGAMVAPLIPGLSDHEIPLILKTISQAGAKSAGYTIVRLNGAIGTIFEDWLKKNYPDRFDKVWHMIQSCHAGHVNDSRFGERMKGDGKIAQVIADNFRLHCKINGINNDRIKLNHSLFEVPNNQLKLF